MVLTVGRQGGQMDKWVKRPWCGLKQAPKSCSSWVLGLWSKPTQACDSGSLVTLSVPQFLLCKKEYNSLYLLVVGRVKLVHRDKTVKTVCGLEDTCGRGTWDCSSYCQGASVTQLRGLLPCEGGCSQLLLELMGFQRNLEYILSRAKFFRMLPNIPSVR